jgi:hypothetical protein
MMFYVNVKGRKYGKNPISKLLKPMLQVLGWFPIPLKQHPTRQPSGANSLLYPYVSFVREQASWGATPYHWYSAL